MNNAPAIFRSLIIYAICVPLAITVGYMLTDPLDYSTAAIYGMLALTLSLPILLRWHYPLMLLCFNTGMVVFFVKGSPSLGLVMVALSLGISTLERILSREKSFIRVPQVTWPLLCLVLVVVFTAKLTGGFGFKAFVSDVYGGRKYLNVLAGIATYFAFTAQRIPPKMAKLYLSLYLLGWLATAVGDLFPITPSWLWYIFWVFPPSGSPEDPFEVGVTRLNGVGLASCAILFWLLAMYGLRGILLGGKLWRPVLLALAFGLSFLGGFRLMLFGTIFSFGMFFFLERLHRTKLLLVFALVATLGAVAVVPLARHLPYTFQRTLAFLPLDISPDAKQSADDSTQWRIDMWKALLPQIPPHLLLGKGYAISLEDFQMMGHDVAFHAADASQQGLALASDFHNGPISVILPFGIWGAIVFLWLVIAGMWAMYCNYRHGDESLRTINTFLWVSCLLFIVRFFFLFGTLSTDMMYYAAMVGLSVAVNGGVRRTAPQPVQARQPMDYPAKILPHPRPVFHR
jgi:hypothetical protein